MTAEAPQDPPQESAERPQSPREIVDDLEEQAHDETDHTAGDQAAEEARTGTEDQGGDATEEQGGNQGDVVSDVPGSVEPPD